MVLGGGSIYINMSKLIFIIVYCSLSDSNQIFATLHGAVGVFGSVLSPIECFLLLDGFDDRSDGFNES